MAAPSGVSGVFWDAGGAVYNAQTAGCVGDDAFNNASALAAAVVNAKTLGAYLYLPAGTYRFASALTWTDLAGIVGPGVLKPTSALNNLTAITIDTAVGSFGVPPQFLWDGPILDGVLTSGCKGLLLGGNALTARLHFRNGWIRRFVGGTTSFGVHVRNTVQTSFENTMIQLNRVNALIEGSTGDFATTTRFLGCNLREADTNNIVIEHAHQVHFYSCILEANDEYALLVQPGAGQQVRQVVLADCWFEDNWRSLVGDPTTRATKFAILADGSTGTLRHLSLIRPRFGEVCRSADLFTVVEGCIDEPEIIGALSDTFKIRGSSVLSLDNWPHGSSVDTLTDIAAGNIVLRDGSFWLDVAINFGSVAAGAQTSGATTFTGAVIGDRVEITSSADQQGQRIWGYVNAANSVTVVQTNGTAGAVNLGAWTARMHLRRSA